MDKKTSRPPQRALLHRSGSYCAFLRRVLLLCALMFGASHFTVSAKEHNSETQETDETQETITPTTAGTTAEIQAISVPSPENPIIVPRVRVFGHDGTLLWDRHGMDDRFGSELQAVLDGKDLTPDPQQTLATEFSHLETHEGTPLTSLDLPTADFTVVKHWSVWCAPCRTQSQVLKTVLKANPELRVHLIHAEFVAPSEG